MSRATPLKRRSIGLTQLVASKKEELKAAREKALFEEFCAVAGLAPKDVTAQLPPRPDIRCTVNGVQKEFELVEITDQSVAIGLAQSIKTGEVTGGAFSQEEPLLYSFESKQKKTYQASSTIELLAYYDKQYPWSYEDPTFIPGVITPTAKTMIDSGVWSRIWVYDTWKKNVLWVYP